MLADQDPAGRVHSMPTMRVLLAQRFAKSRRDLSDRNAGLEILSPVSERDEIELTPLRF